MRALSAIICNARKYARKKIFVHKEYEIFYIFFFCYLKCIEYFMARMTCLINYLNYIL